MFKRKRNGNTRYIKHESGTRVSPVHFLRVGRFEDEQAPIRDIHDILEGNELRAEVLEGIYQRYLDEYRKEINIRTNAFQRVLRHAKAFVRHESYEVDPHSLPPVNAILIRLENSDGADADYVNQVYKTACHDAIKRAETASERWNKAKEIANIVLPIPLGIAAFLAGYVAGAEGTGWAALAEFGPYAALPLAVWARKKEHDKRAELEKMAKGSTPNGQLEETRASVKMYNAIKDGASFWVPVVFDSAMTSLSYSGAIPTSSGYMTGIVAAPYAAHGMGFVSMLNENGRDERAAILRKMMGTNVIVADSRTPTEEIVGRYL